MGHYKIGARFGTSEKRNLFSVIFCTLYGKNNQFRITIVNTLQLTNYYLWRSNNLNNLAVCDCYSVLVRTPSPTDTFIISFL